MPLYSNDIYKVNLTIPVNIRSTQEFSLKL